MLVFAQALYGKKIPSETCQLCAAVLSLQASYAEVHISQKLVIFSVLDTHVIPFTMGFKFFSSICACNYTESLWVWQMVLVSLWGAGTNGPNLACLQQRIYRSGLRNTSWSTVGCLEKQVCKPFQGNPDLFRSVWVQEDHCVIS